MIITSEITSLRNFEAWAGAKDNLKEVLENGKMDELDALVEELFCEEPVSETTLNDFLWFRLPEFYPELLEK
jgi:hypothetical protein